MPQGVEHVWVWFNELASARGGSGFGANPISWPDMAAWSALTGASPNPWEVSLIRRLDAAYLASTVKTKSKGGAAKKQEAARS